MVGFEPNPEDWMGGQRSVEGQTSAGRESEQEGMLSSQDQQAEHLQNQTKLSRNITSRIILYIYQCPFIVYHCYLFF